MSGRAQDLTGRYFPNFTVIRQDYSSQSGETQWLCRCDCGTMTIKWRSTLLKPGIHSCGCVRYGHSRQKVTRHGMRHLPEYEVFYGMKARCENPNHAMYQYYGGRGIRVECF